MISKRTQENLVAAVIFFVFAVALYLSFGYGPRARMVPVPIAVLGIVLMAIQVIWQNMRSSDDLHIDTVDLFAGRANPGVPDEDKKDSGVAGSADGQPAVGPSGWRRWLSSELAPFALVASFLALFLVLGPLLAIFIFSATYFVLSGHCTLVRGLIYSVVCLSVLYLMFGVVLDVDLNRGLAMPFINQFVRF